MDHCTYRGCRVDEPHRLGRCTKIVSYQSQGGTTEPLDTDGPFDWGHDGDHAINLARAILHHATGSPHHARLLACAFVSDFVSHWSDEWSMPAADVYAWIGRQIAADVRDRLPAIAAACAAAPIKPVTLTEAIAAGVDGFEEIAVEAPKPSRLDTVSSHACASRIYRGRRTNDAVEVNVTHTSDGETVVYTLSPETSLRVRQLHDGFNWGFVGRAAEQLALAILLDATARFGVATANYIRFADEVVSTWGDRWSIDALEILRWLADNGGFVHVKWEEVAHA